VDELPKEVIKDMKIHFAKKYAEVENIVFKTL
jgi:ATP-dependent Lon protease